VQGFYHTDPLPSRLCVLLDGLVPRSTTIQAVTVGGSEVSQVASGREQYMQALASLTEMTRTQAERVAARLARQGDLQSGQVSRVAEDLLRRTQKNRETVSRLVQREVKRQLGMLGIASRDEVARLQQRVRALEQELARADATRSTAAKSGSTRTAAAKSGTTRTAAAKARTATRSGGASTRSSATGGRGAGGRPTRASKPTPAEGAEIVEGEAPSQS
jgi:polyhydroxyalkanoate synthesis regulator phasin